MFLFLSFGSSAFMALAARFPLQRRSTTHNGEGKSTSGEEQDVSILGSDDFTKQQSNISNQVYDRGSMRIQEVDLLEEKEMASSNESFSSNTGGCTTDSTKSKHIAAFQTGSEICQESSENRADMAFTITGNACLMGVEDRKAMESVVSSQASVISSQNSTESIVLAADTIGSSSESNSETENLINQFEGNDFSGCTSFLDLLQMKGTDMLREFYVNGDESIPSKENFDGGTNQLKDTEYGRKISCKGVECLNGVGPYNSTNSTHHPQARQEFKGILENCSGNYHSCIGPRSGSELGNAEALGEENRLYFPPTASGITEIKENCCTVERTNECDVQRKQLSNAQTPLKGDSSIPLSKHPVHPSPTSIAKPFTHLDAEESSSLVDKQTFNAATIAGPSLVDEVYSSRNISRITAKNDLKEKRGTRRAEKKEFDWDSLRKQACPNGPKKERSSGTMDSADWEAVRCADVNEIAKTIRERGMSNMLSERIKVHNCDTQY